MLLVSFSSTVPPPGQQAFFSASMSLPVPSVIAAANPLALRGEDLDPAMVERERSIASEKAAESGKPAEIVAKMVEGAIAKFRKENALLSQLFVIDNKTKVEDVVAAEAKRLGAPVTLKSYLRFQLGEGIEKKETDFAAEVAAAAGKPEPVQA